ncbi:hypothetical protein M441DRAFT_444596 [Trichoderma asperellum CBS 433.97]|uniref:Uncharacterized protein n=1 Tax=Trichoderma asperellum (strain ATCC 204424 / CBS 433.97 / NBRC 101777) TaxID=1042311 RepID=A0A2T3ZMP6_TRIA4|nr:hypothetical protein M441DRAFT_444596 [Trichoderma asperellum CBS 433.97]PTB46073.1 hypothetical protein M441DRAFT_444596 [Trichoderma asperellum CBS 433.97]
MAARLLGRIQRLWSPDHARITVGVGVYHPTDWRLLLNVHVQTKFKATASKGKSKCVAAGHARHAATCAYAGLQRGFSLDFGRLPLWPTLARRHGAAWGTEYARPRYLWYGAPGGLQSAPSRSGHQKVNLLGRFNTLRAPNTINRTPLLRNSSQTQTPKTNRTKHIRHASTLRSTLYSLTPGCSSNQT